MLALSAGACVRTVAAEVTSTSGRSVVASSVGGNRYIPSARESPARAASSSAGGWRAARVIAPLRAAASPRLGIGRASSAGTLENPRGRGAVVANARAGRSSGSHGSANDPDDPEQEREMLNNVQPSKSPEKKNNRPPAVADQPAKKPSASSSSDAKARSDARSDAKEAKAKTEKFELDKKRLELIMEEKEWDLERVGSDPAEKMERLSEYVTAVEAYKSLCATQVPNTVSDLLSQYVQVSTLDPGADGYDKAVEFLNLDFSDDDEERDPEEVEAIQRMAKNFGRGGTGDKGAGDEEPGFTPKEVDDIIRLLGEMGELRGSDGDDDDSDDELDEEELMRNFLGGFLDNPGTLHLAQDVEGNWRWLEDDLGRPLATKPEGEFNVKVMSHEEMVQLGLNVNSLHEEVDPAELIDFSGCKSWDEAIRVGREVEAALDHMRADGWEVDTRSWCNEGEHLMVVKELTPLRTMSFVEGVKGKSNAKSKRKAGKKSKKTEGKA